MSANEPRFILRRRFVGHESVDSPPMALIRIDRRQAFDRCQIEGSCRPAARRSSSRGHCLPSLAGVLSRVFRSIFFLLTLVPLHEWAKQAGREGFLLSLVVHDGSRLQFRTQRGQSLTADRAFQWDTSYPVPRTKTMTLQRCILRRLT